MSRDLIVRAEASATLVANVNAHRPNSTPLRRPDAMMGLNVRRAQLACPVGDVRARAGSCARKPDRNAGRVSSVRNTKDVFQ